MVTLGTQGRGLLCQARDNRLTVLVKERQEKRMVPGPQRTLIQEAASEIRLLQKSLKSQRKDGEAAISEGRGMLQ